MAQPYSDGCHVRANGRLPTRFCYYGNLSSGTTIAIYGDSHALAWFPALLNLANYRGWRLLSLTMSACIPADIIPYDPTAHVVMKACQVWRKAALARLAKVHPAIVIVTGTRSFVAVSSTGRLLSGQAATALWKAGMGRTLAGLKKVASHVIEMADTPRSRLPNTGACLAAHLASELACATSVSSAVSYPWLNVEYQAALKATVGFVDPELWVCPSSPCPLVIGTHVVYRNEGHMTASFVATIWKSLRAAVPVP